MELPTSLSTIFHYLFDLIKKFLVSGAVSDFIHKLSDLTDTFLASDTVVHVLQWFKKENVHTMVAVVVIILLFLSCCGCLSWIVCSCCRCLAWIVGSCCGCLAKSVRSCCGCLAWSVKSCRGGPAKSGKTMKAPGRNSRIPRSNFEASPLLGYCHCCNKYPISTRYIGTSRTTHHPLGIK
ncbi:hypothetical protein NC653_041916 [Populus alba x Populus x berolinensis]|uniref:Uncharacterized protein n=1 Tax=Populus alba x Populus x berolinensis TaxID=444605 RepID=A0AAD6L9Q1_9ROSI|nr:hypothetical protein NC653_041916 [Populus alba x Populus x berolinensis]